MVTTETLPVEALCFLCGSASSEAGADEEMLLCKSCCEPYHPFCLNPEGTSINYVSMFEGGEGHIMFMDAYVVEGGMSEMLTKTF